MTRVSFYSFKGGTGRSSATANVAYYLAKTGANVGCIDFDIESAGLNFIYDIPPGAMRGGYIQDFLINPEKYSDKSSFGNLVVNVGIEKDWKLKGGNLYFIPADTNAKKTSAVNVSPLLLPRVKSLLSKFEEFFNLKYLLIDSRSGVSELALPSLLYADVLLVFFRWGRQNREGTYTLVPWVTEWLKTANPNAKVFLVASNIPHDISQGEIEIYEKTLKEYGTKIVATVYENESLKKTERILVHEDPNGSTAKEYTQIAESIIKSRR